MFVIIILIVVKNKLYQDLKPDFVKFAIIALALLYARTLAENSGAAVNPAIALGFEFLHTLITGTRKMTYYYVYILGPFGGAIVAAIIFKMFLYDNKEAEEKKQN